MKFCITNEDEKLVLQEDGHRKEQVCCVAIILEIIIRNH